MNQPLVKLSPQDMDRLSRLMVTMSQRPETRPMLAEMVSKVDPESAKAFGDVFLEK